MVIIPSKRLLEIRACLKEAIAWVDNKKSHGEKTTRHRDSEVSVKLLSILEDMRMAGASKREIEVHYLEESHHLIIGCLLPAPDLISQASEYRLRIPKVNEAYELSIVGILTRYLTNDYDWSKIADDLRHYNPTKISKQAGELIACMSGMTKEELKNRFETTYVRFNTEEEIRIFRETLIGFLHSIGARMDPRKWTQKEQSSLYELMIYQIVLSVLFAAFDLSDDAIDMATFNGWVRFTDSRTGNETTACIVSVQTTKETFKTINVLKVDPRECFKYLKGVGSPRLIGLTPVAPIQDIDRRDRRFIASHPVAESLNEGLNLASMEWAEFEHLVRELFEKEFGSTGGEVRVTQASRDGGVDAVAFDPDPIRGGKIVIQAKRYTNVVGVAAVRDLYGTVINEGAMKGILITTSEYGHDAFEFAKGKPLTLLNGANLLHLLQRHGYKARIDLVEAKVALSEGKSPHRK